VPHLHHDTRASWVASRPGEEGSSPEHPSSPALTNGTFTDLGYRASSNGVTTTPQAKSLRRKGSTMERLVTSLGEVL
jgi:hypothetical protein